MSFNNGFIFCLAAMLLGTTCWAQGELIIYPNSGQSKEQQDKDSYECYGWAKQ